MPSCQAVVSVIDGGERITIRDALHIYFDGVPWRLVVCSTRVTWFGGKKSDNLVDIALHDKLLNQFTDA